MIESSAELGAVPNTLTATREPIDLDGDIGVYRLPLLEAGTTIVTKADGDNNEQDYDDDDVVALAGTTTLTESRGDHESDPEDDDVRSATEYSTGHLRPLLYRFAEQGASLSLRVRYDPSREVNILANGRSVVTALLERANRN